MQVHAYRVLWKSSTLFLTNSANAWRNSNVGSVHDLCYSCSLNEGVQCHSSFPLSYTLPCTSLSLDLSPRRCMHCHYCVVADRIPRFQWMHSELNINPVWAGAVCGSVGIMDALNMKWLEEVMTWQDRRTGCFKEAFNDAGDWSAEESQFGKDLENTRSVFWLCRTKLEYYDSNESPAVIVASICELYWWYIGGEHRYARYAAHIPSDYCAYAAYQKSCQRRNLAGRLYVTN